MTLQTSLVVMSPFGSWLGASTGGRRRYPRDEWIVARHRRQHREWRALRKFRQ